MQGCGGGNGSSSTTAAGNNTQGDPSSPAWAVQAKASNVAPGTYHCDTRAVATSGKTLATQSQDIQVSTTGEASAPLAAFPSLNAKGLAFIMSECTGDNAPNVGGMTTTPTCLLTGSTSCLAVLTLSTDAEPVVHPMAKFLTDSQPTSNGFFCDLLAQGLDICGQLFPGSENPLELAICTLVGILNDTFCLPDETVAVCGNGVCEGDEQTTCLQDCQVSGTCGDNAIQAGEVCDTDKFECPGLPEGATLLICSEDCKTCLYCGDGNCNKSENVDNCPQDCQNAQPVCGNGILEGYEQCDGAAGTCPEGQFCDRFCACGFCGNGTCMPNEADIGCPDYCPADCPSAGPGPCGLLGECDDCSPCNHNGTCEPLQGETNTSCDDCVVCGDGECTGSETIDNCPADCFVCGDGVCHPLEMGWCSDCGVVNPK